MSRLNLTVSEYAGIGGRRPVSGGVPLPEGAAPAGRSLVLLDGAGQCVPLQTQILGVWKDGSARWVLLDFMLDAGAGSSTSLSLVYGDDVVPLPDDEVAAVSDVDLGETGIGIEGTGQVELVAVSDAGEALHAAFSSCTVETSGPVRQTCVCTGAITRSDGTHLMSVRVRISHYPATGALRLEPLVIVDSSTGIMQHLCELRMDITPSAARVVKIGGAAWEGGLGEHVRLFQVDDETWRLEGAEVAAEGKRAPGWMELQAADGVTALALRDFREQWPKSLGVNDGCVAIGLLPAFEAGEFEHMEPWFKYQYLFEGDCYRLRTGQARRWEIWLQPDVAGDTLTRFVNAPLIPAPDPAAAIATGVWGAIAPAGISAMSD